MWRILAWCLSLLCLILLPPACGPAPEPEPELPAEPVEEGPPKPPHGAFVTIPAGEFTMGSDIRPDHLKDRPALHEPEHTVDLPAYQIHVYEVTNAEFTRFQIESDYVAEGDWRSFSSMEKAYYPVANVTLEDAKAYCAWVGGRLPSEAEWEKAARSSDGRPYPWGDKWDPTKSNCNEMGFANLVEVGQIEADRSPYGVQDMMGNAQEWTRDKLAPYPKSPARRDPNFKRGFYSARGGSYAIKGGSIALWTRGAYLPKGQFGTGFRCVKEVEETPAESEGKTR
jgi:formylglycine-generating enzyme required for sulfatase activity